MHLLQFSLVNIGENLTNLGNCSTDCPRSRYECYIAPNYILHFILYYIVRKNFAIKYLIALSEFIMLINMVWELIIFKLVSMT